MARRGERRGRKEDERVKEGKFVKEGIEEATRYERSNMYIHTLPLQDMRFRECYTNGFICKWLVNASHLCVGVI